MRGEAGIDSDVDLMVVMNSDALWYKRSTPIRLALSERWIEPIDIIVRSPKVFAQRQSQQYTLEYEAAKDGVVLYEKRLG